LLAEGWTLMRLWQSNNKNKELENQADKLLNSEDKVYDQQTQDALKTYDSSGYAPKSPDDSSTR
jgi:hypothetical protein